MSNSRLKTVGLTACLVLGAWGGAACRQDMHDNPKFKPYRDGAFRQLPEGTVARGSLDLNPPAPKITTAPAAPSTAAAPVAGATGVAGAVAAATPQAIPKGEDGFPFKITKEILDRGENRYNISCLPCHGKLGDANGM